MAAGCTAVLLAVLTPGSVQAGFTVCNQTLDIANVSVGIVGGAEEASGEAARSRGWWVVAPNRCAEIEADDLGEERWHVLALDVRGEVLVDGAEQFCTAPRSFEIEGRAECWLRGHTKGRFLPVETGGARDWTVFLREGTDGQR